MGCQHGYSPHYLPHERVLTQGEDADQGHSQLKLAVVSLSFGNYWLGYSDSSHT